MGLCLDAGQYPPRVWDSNDWGWLQQRGKVVCPGAAPSVHTADHDGCCLAQCPFQERSDAPVVRGGSQGRLGSGTRGGVVNWRCKGGRLAQPPLPRPMLAAFCQHSTAGRAAIYQAAPDTSGIGSSYFLP